MKALDIAIIVFCIQVAAFLVQLTGLFGTQPQVMTDWINQTDKEELQQQEYNAGFIEQSFNLGEDIVKGVFYIIRAIGRAVFGVPYTMQMFGVSQNLSYYLSAPFYILYFIGIGQLISNRRTKGMR